MPSSRALSDRGVVNQAIDIHGHAMPLPVLQWLGNQGLADLSSVGAGTVQIDAIVSGVGPGTPLPLASSMTDAGIRLMELDDLRLRAQAVSLPPFLMASRSTDRELAIEVTRRGNYALAEYCSADPQRLLPLGLLPVGWEGAAEEARRCLDDLGMRGLAIGSRGAGLDLDAAVNDDLWSFLTERQCFVFLHPSAIPDPMRLADYWLPQLVGYPVETAIAASRLVFAGKVGGASFALCLAHGGGCLPALRGRLDLGWERKEQARTIAVPPSRVLRSLYYDTAVFDPIALRRLVEDVGASQVLVGTDHPFDLAERDPVGLVDAAALADDERAAVLHANAERLLRLG
jgi:aminocarboxymuconate-semialdehyde decarboxylase